MDEKDTGHLTVLRKGQDEEQVKVDEKDTNRLEAFSDGVFAVAITLLILNIKTVPLDAAGKLLKGSEVWGWLLDQGPTLIAFGTSFFTIGIMWINHHRLFKHIARTDTGLLLFNLFLMVTIVFIPVPTALLAQYITLPDAGPVAAIYSGTCFMMACCFNLLWRYASYHDRLLAKDVDQRAVKAISQQYLFGPLLYAISVGLAWVNVPACVIFNFVLALFFAAPARLPRYKGLINHGRK